MIIALLIIIIFILCPELLVACFEIAWCLFLMALVIGVVGLLIYGLTTIF